MCYKCMFINNTQRENIYKAYIVSGVKRVKGKNSISYLMSSDNNKVYILCIHILSHVSTYVNVFILYVDIYRNKVWV